LRELELAIHSSKKRSSPGLDLITAVFVRYLLIY